MNGESRSDAKFTAGDFLIRFAAALAIVLLTYNPTRFSFVSWLKLSLSDGSAGALHALVGVVLVIGWTIYLRTTWTSLGALGLVLAGALLAALVWVLVSYDLLAVHSMSAAVWVTLVCLALLLAVGMSWGHWKRRASGQVEVDEVAR